ncbi:DUF6481 family protein [Rhizobium binxianense]
MRHPDDNSFAERRKTAENAKRELLTKFASAPKATDPALQERLAAREAVALARKARRAERDAMKAEENERLLSDAATLAEAAEAARQAEINNRISRAAADEIERKAERDRRYAARKARRS